MIPYCPGLQEREVQPVGPPYGARPFNPFAAIPLPAPAAGDVTLFTIKVPVGYDGIILGQSNGFINTMGGGTFIEGSGDLVWRIAINLETCKRYLKDCGAITVSLGQINVYQTVPGGMRVLSGNSISYIVNCPNTSGALPLPGIGQVFAGLHGWLWPRGSSTEVVGNS